MRSAARLYLSVLALVLVSSPLLAQEAATPTDNELKRKGDEALEQKQYAEALAAYEAAYALHPTPALLYNRGRALQFLARYPEALDMIEEFEKTAPPDLRDRVRGLSDLLVALRSKVTTITVNCEIPGARVLVGQHQVGVAPLPGPLRVNAGKQSIDVFADGFFPYHRDMILPGAGQVVIDVALTSRDRSGLLIVKSTLPSVQVKVDDEILGLAPAEVGLLAGAHRVHVDKDGYQAASTQIVLQIGERKELTLDPLPRRSPIYATWWFWTGIAVLAAGGATTVIALTTERSAPNGDFSPGRVNF